MSELTCRVIEIIRGTTHDGPGMRTTVFLQGCPLRCLWCQNPEGLSTGLQIWWEQSQCLRCLACVEDCSAGALTEDEQGLHRDPSTCTLCGACVEACPAQAMTFTSQEWTLDRLVEEALKDRDYFAAFGGGVTVSGGEPLRHPRFVAEFLRRLQEQDVHTALDTCGLAPVAALQSVLPHVNAVLFDLKLADPELHRQYTGHSNERILENLSFLADHVRAQRQSPPPGGGAPLQLWIRTPLIPDTTATEANLSALGSFVRERLLDVVGRWELCAFNSACRAKYEKLGLSWHYAKHPLLGQAHVARLRAAALSASGLAEDQLAVSGLIARD
jgi:pyruvate formate lyase activating enzyme